MPKDEIGQVYVLHFERKLSHAQHYIGYVEGTGQEAVEKRLQQHRSGQGAVILDAANKAGINYEVASVRDGTRKRNEKPKKRK